jgi:hypothetical protein
MKAIVFFLILCFANAGIVNSQNNAAYQYLSSISDNGQNISKRYMSYSSAVAHSKKARKVENKRQDLLKAVADARKKAQALSCFENDCALRDSLVSFLTISYYVLNSDYEKIVNMEEVAEQSYDLMEAYLNAREMANGKVETAGNILGNKFDEFAKKYNIPVSDNKSKLSKDIEKSNRVNDHYNIVFLVFFKSYKQEAYLIDAINRKDYSSAEQNRNALLQVAAEGISKLDTMKGFNNDKALIIACKRVLEFHRTEAKDKIGLIIDYFLKQENYDKLDKVIGSKEPMLRTQQEIDQFNKAITDLKAALAKYNPTNNYLNQNRTNTLNAWNTTTQNYLERYIPKYE